jgi:hypothetical protein
LQFLDISKVRPSEYPWHHHDAGTAGERSEKESRGGSEKAIGMGVSGIAKLEREGSNSAKDKDGSGGGGAGGGQAGVTPSAVPISDFVEAVKQWAKICGSEYESSM